MGLAMMVLFIWGIAGVYDAMENGTRPVGFLKVLISGPAFWGIAAVKWFNLNKDKIVR